MANKALRFRDERYSLPSDLPGLLNPGSFVSIAAETPAAGPIVVLTIDDSVADAEAVAVEIMADLGWTLQP